MLRVVDEAGGVTVLAHPWGRHGADSLPESAIDELAGLGLAGLEVDHQDHTPEDREQLRRIARELDLVVTGSSDHHGLGKLDHELGCNTTAPEEYERLLALADAAAHAVRPRDPGGHRMRYTIDAPTLLRIVTDQLEVHPDHQLVAPHAIRSQALTLLLGQVRARRADRAGGRACCTPGSPSSRSGCSATGSRGRRRSRSPTSSTGRRRSTLSTSPSPACRPTRS